MAYGRWVWFLRRPFERIIQRCYEHGISQALQSTQKNALQLLTENGRKAEELKTGLNDNMSSFPFHLLSLGWVIASVVFVGELFCAVKWRRARWGQQRIAPGVLDGSMFGPRRRRRRSLTRVNCGFLNN